ncbi:PTS glucose transporter subunit IIA [Peribacillus sp. NPDC097206]|uniref:PTS sugar transporter subunit IIA n=1 Tax=Peribacillus sp. NPDC097206 TaxID=3364398 RepID=UPI0037F95814
MFSKLFKKTPKTPQLIYAPISGEILSIEEVPDPVFSQKMMGEGMAIVPIDGNVSSPVSGKVIQIAPTKHAIGVLADDGTELLIHVGLETVALKGEGFDVKVNVGDSITVGQLLLTYHLQHIKEHAKSDMLIMVITNSQTNTHKYEMSLDKVARMGETVVIKVTNT